jgi:hypothetical protein
MIASGCSPTGRNYKYRLFSRRGSHLRANGVAQLTRLGGLDDRLIPLREARWLAIGGFIRTFHGVEKMQFELTPIALAAGCSAYAAIRRRAKSLRQK